MAVASVPHGRWDVVEEGGEEGEREEGEAGPGGQYWALIAPPAEK